MPKGPRGERRPADVVSAAVLVGRIATGEAKDMPKVRTAAEESGSKGGKARADALSKKRRAEIARKAATKRWQD